MKDQLEQFEQYAIAVILGQRDDFRAKALRVVLGALSYVFRGLVQTRLALYRHRVLRERNLGTMVISIGNLTVGGTGKTPLVEMFARALAEGGRNVAVLSRGYKSRNKRSGRPAPDQIRLDLDTGRKIRVEPPRVVSDGHEIQLDVHQSGDEPWMLARNLLERKVKVVVDRNRVLGGDHAIANFNCDTLILDDGLQYLKLRHRLDVVLIDSTQPFGNGRLLPRGTLREPPRNLRRASYIFLTKCDGSDTAELHEKIRRHNRHAPIVECTHRPMYLESLITGERRALSLLEGKRVAAISGIAQPQSFEKSLERLGASVEIVSRHADHHFYKDKEVQQFLDRAIDRDVHFVVTTEKDAVRFPGIEEDADLPVYFLRIEIEILDGFANWDDCVRRICQPAYELPPRAFF